MKPMSFLVEGLDGSGKSNAVFAIKDYLMSLDQEFIVTQEPGGTPLAEDIRTLLKRKNDDSYDDFDPMSESLLFCAAKNQLIKNVLEPAALEGKHIIQDRSYTYSGFAYQCFAGSIPEKDFWLIHNTALKKYRDYDVVIYLDIDPKVGLSRVRLRGEPDRIEAKDVSYLDKVRQGYLYLANQKNHMIVIDAEKYNEDEVYAKVQESIKVLIDEIQK
jgi:dTMP kinase